jgi:hydrogenase maturation factor HypF (carbamoyltransferase family)
MPLDNAKTARAACQQRKPTSPISKEIAPRQDPLGVMLPYSPLNYLLFEPNDDEEIEPVPVKVLVMTSGNLSEEPIATDNDIARSRLAGLADAFLMHSHPVRTRCDDLVVRVIKPGIHSPANSGRKKKDAVFQYYRRSRG